MSNASLKEQLQAVASQLSDKVSKEHKPLQKKPQLKDKPKKPKPKWLDYVQYGVELLRVYFPAGFKQSNEVKPLKKGIKQDLVLRLSTLENIVTEDKACMVKSLAYYVNTAAYYKSVVEGTMRIDLDGNPAEVVTAEEAKYSIERHQAKLLAKQGQQQQQQHQQQQQPQQQ
jgi:ProP effector